MNWFDAHPAIVPFLLSVMAQITLILAVAMVAQACFIRSAALRHAILLSALLTIPATPIFALFIKSLQHKTILSQFPIHAALPLSAPIASTYIYFSTFHGAPIVHALPWAAAIAAIWFFNTLFLLIRCVIGIRSVRRIAANAHDISPSIPASIQSELLHLFGRIPPILESADLTVPIAVGIYSPAVILPAGLLSQGDPPTLLQILIHESAHANRRDPFTGLYQRVLSALLWFHPLLHLANHRLGIAREEICDNHVLARATPPDYARTLLHLASSMLPARADLLSPMLLRSPSSLNKRIAHLLKPRRSVMTNIGISRKLLVAGALVGVACVSAVMAASPATKPVAANDGDVKDDVIIMSPPTGTGATTLPHKDDTMVIFGNVKLQGRNVASDHAVFIPPQSALPYAIDWRAGAIHFLHGDNIIITEIHGTSRNIAAGNIYCIRGAYALKSHDHAVLAVFVTGNGPSTPTFQVQTALINKGDGAFTLYLPMGSDGSPHASFYPADGGESFGGVYFGTGDSILKDSRSVHDSIGH